LKYASARTSAIRRHRRLLVLIVVASSVLESVGARVVAATLRVGPQETIASIAEAASVARDGDIVEIMSGSYVGDVAVWTQKRLTIRGIGVRPLLIANNKSAEGKAIWVFRDGDFLVENIAFTGARVDDRNGAGIRFERGRLTVRRCEFTDNENGILGGDAASELVVEDSEFSRAPRDRGSLMHLLYVGGIRRFTLTGSRFHQGFEGHLVKSRARENYIRYNLLYDGSGGEASYELEFPNGGIAYVVGNVIGQSSETTNPFVVAFGAEGSSYATNALYLVHNTLLSDRLIGAWFLRVWREKLPADTEIVASNNLTVGIGLFSVGNDGTFAGNFPVLPLALGDPATLDFMLGSQSLLRGRGVEPPTLNGHWLAPTHEFNLPIGTHPIARPEAWTPGAFQTTDPRR
jgi:Right handed beta helix region